MKKMMFNDHLDLTEEVVEKRKTQTRRTMKNQNGNLAGQVKFTKKGRKLVYVRADFDNGISVDCPYAIGEIVAVAQSYNNIFQAGYNVPTGLSSSASENKMFVRADLMPHQIRILDVRAERLQDISDEDCLREGIYKDECKTYFNGYAFDLTRCEGNCVLATQWYKSPKEAFSALIDKISGRGTWDSNPYVWRIEFELVK